MPTLYIIAGPNGAGKTTAAYQLLPFVFNTVEFVNADEIARGLSPFNFEGVTFQAGRIMLERLYQLLRENKNFAFETTLSGLSYLNFIQQAKKAGYEIVLFYVWLESDVLAKSRVAIRVGKGGHYIPNETVERRYKKGIKNLRDYLFLADQWYIYDNSETSFQLIASSINKQEIISNFTIFRKIFPDDN
ncbi:zeta toxin family protein [soil metagenome]